MKHFVSAMIALAIGVSLCVSTSALAQGSGHKWSKRFGGVGYDQTLQQVTDAAGNIYVIGFLFTSIDFGGGNLTAADNYDVFIAKFGPNPPCFADVVVDGTVNVSDLLAVINGWGPCPGACTAPCPADIVHDCTVNVIDLLAVINGWGACP